MIAILGATGNVGGKIAAMPTAKHEPIRVIARTEDRLKPLVGKNVTAFAGDIGNGEFLVKALEGVDAVFTLIPPNPTAPEFLSYADRIGGSITKAVETAKVKYVVNLSSIGAEQAEATGPITGLRRMEERLNGIRGLQVLHLRAAYFMENLLWNIDLIRSKGIAGSAVRGDVRIPMIATRDIAAYAAERLVKRDYTGSSVRYLLGQRDLTLAEAAGVIGSRISMPGLPYVAFSYDEAEKGMVAMGLSPDMSRTYVEMARAFNEGKIRVPDRTSENTTPTTIEEFCSEVFVPAFTQKMAA
jgi:uncharacterized protein YbjT (DUF2867 family)